MRLPLFVISISLPVFWAGRFSVADIAAALVTVLLAAIAKSLNFHLALCCLLSSYWIQIYLPVADSGGIWAVPFTATGLILALRWADESGGLTATKEAIRSLWTYPSVFLAVAVPLALGCVVAAAFLASPLNLPAVFVPTGGILGVIISGSLWYWLTRLLARRAAEIGWAPLGAALFVPIVIGLVTVFGNILPTVFKVRTSLVSPQELEGLQMSEWIELLNRADAVGFPPYDRFVRNAALRSKAIQDDPPMWVEIAKGGFEQLSENIEGVSEFWKRLAWGGRLVSKDDLILHEDPCVAMEIDLPRNTLWTLTSKGRLSSLSPEGDRKFQFEPVQSEYVDCAVSPFQPGIFLLENCGRLARFDGGAITTISQGSCEPSRQVFRRLKVDPSTGDLWALDLYGILYHTPSEKMWFMDSRFQEGSRRGDIVADVARDFCITPNGTIALLTCDGEIWTSSKESSEIKGPIRGTHYFPDYPVAQSIDGKNSAYGFVDRYGGFFHIPYPSRIADLHYRATYLFPRGIFIDEDEVDDGKGVVDHEYLDEKRWLYLLTADGRLFTNFKGMGTEAN